MTSPRITPAGISALAALVHEIRPDWDRRGTAGVLHKLADTVPPAALIIAATRAACDPTNDTPEAFAHLNNRAWDSDWYLPCNTHPLTRARRTDGECAACWTDRHAALRPLPLRNRGVAPTLDVRKQLVAAFTPSTPPAASDPATSSGATPTRSTEGTP